MVLFNYATKEITLKVVYYGPGLCGKTTNLQHIHSRLNPKTRGKLISLATEADRTLFFDFLPMEMGTIKGFRIRFQLYTVPGQVRYNATRKLVLKGSDGVVFVVDSQNALMDQNIESLDNLKENLVVNGLDPDEIPLVIQFNKRDLTDISSVSELNEKLNYRGVPYFESIAINGEGVLETFKEITKVLLKRMGEKHSAEVKEVEEEFLEKDISKEAAFGAEEVSKYPAEGIQPTVEVKESVTEEITPEAIEIAEEEVVEPAEYASQPEGTSEEEDVFERAGSQTKTEPQAADSSKVIEEYKMPEYITELETPYSEETYTRGYETPEEKRVEEQPLMTVSQESLDGILNNLKWIMEKLDSLPKILSEFNKNQETLTKRIADNEEALRKKDEEILKSLNDLKVKVESLGERPDKKWFRLH